ncbi:MAG: molybdenum cofactor guanylyltransferase [Gammaproteobacteria bacterium]|nr:molybdenum cofactor guanylyltransferase [Gammaproteobacteria bacterium]
MENIAVTKHIFTGVILAGGQARRMGGQDKGLIELAGSPMVQYVLDAISPQVGHVIINANRNQEIYAHYGCPIIADEFEGFCGPLAGMASSLRSVTSPYMVTAPCDSPFIPKDLVQRLYLQLLHEEAEISVAHNGERLQPVFTLMKTTLLDSILEFLGKDERKIDKWFELHKLAITDFSDCPDTFININTQDDLSVVESRLKASI